MNPYCDSFVISSNTLHLPSAAILSRPKKPADILHSPCVYFYQGRTHIYCIETISLNCKTECRYHQSLAFSFALLHLTAMKNCTRSSKCDEEDDADDASRFSKQDAPLRDVVIQPVREDSFSTLGVNTYGGDDDDMSSVRTTEKPSWINNRNSALDSFLEEKLEKEDDAKKIDLETLLLQGSRFDTAGRNAAQSKSRWQESETNETCRDIVKTAMKMADDSSVPFSPPADRWGRAMSCRNLRLVLEAENDQAPSKPVKCPSVCRGPPKPQRAKSLKNLHCLPQDVDRAPSKPQKCPSLCPSEDISASSDKRRAKSCRNLMTLLADQDQAPSKPVKCPSLCPSLNEEVSKHSSTLLGDDEIPEAVQQDPGSPTVASAALSRWMTDPTNPGDGTPKRSGGALREPPLSRSSTVKHVNKSNRPPSLSTSLDDDETEVKSTEDINSLDGSGTGKDQSSTCSSKARTAPRIPNRRAMMAATKSKSERFLSPNFAPRLSDFRKTMMKGGAHVNCNVDEDSLPSIGEEKNIMARPSMSAKQRSKSCRHISLKAMPEQPTTDRLSSFRKQRSSGKLRVNKEAPCRSLQRQKSFRGVSDKPMPELSAFRRERSIRKHPTSSSFEDEKSSRQMSSRCLIQDTSSKQKSFRCLMQDASSQSHCSPPSIATTNNCVNSRREGVISKRRAQSKQLAAFGRQKSAPCLTKLESYGPNGPKPDRPSFEKLCSALQCTWSRNGQQMYTSCVAGG